MTDVRDYIFAGIQERSYRAVLTPERGGILSGMDEATRVAEELGLVWKCSCKEGGILKPGTPFAELTAGPKQIAIAAVSYTHLRSVCLEQTCLRLSGYPDSHRDSDFQQRPSKGRAG